MTDNEIIELLNACDVSHIKIQCVESILSDTRCTTHFDLSRIVDLINRQKAELSRAKDYIELLEIEKQALKEDSDKSKATAMGVIKRQDEKIARLRENNEAIMQTIADVREVVVKEFAERLNEIAHYEEIWTGEDEIVYKTIDFEDIEELIEELVGAESG